MTTTTTAVKHQSVRNVPLDGFGTRSPEAKNEKFADETVQERNKFAVEHNIDTNEVPTCSQQYPYEDRGFCTRVGGPERHTGMHYAGNRTYLVGAW